MVKWTENINGEPYTSRGVRTVRGRVLGNPVTVMWKGAGYLAYVITTNIKVDGKRISIHNIGKTLSEVARKDLEKEYGLIKAEGRDNSINIFSSLNPEKALYGKLPTKKTITNIVTYVLEEYKFTSFAEYNTVLGSLGIKADRGPDSSIMFQKRGLIYSIIDKNDKPIGIPFKASSLENKPVLDAVEAKFESNKENRKPYQDNLKIKVDNILEKYTMITQSTFLYELKKLGVDLILRKNEQGFLYGSTFIDHKNKTVFNGSTLGKNYSAKGLTERFGNDDVLKSYLTPKNTANRFLNVDTNDVSKSFLPPVKQTHYLSDLLGKDKDDVDMEIHRKKKKRRGRFL